MVLETRCQSHKPRWLKGKQLRIGNLIVISDPFVYLVRTCRRTELHRYEIIEEIPDRRL